jgi:(1->4)-alpha-D-glucan 1-alpha-D-glucosylmutase
MTLLPEAHERQAAAGKQLESHVNGRCLPERAPGRATGSETGPAATADTPSLPRPRATYRLQFNSSFTFRDACGIVPYLAALGISDCYASPFCKARVGSQHGYDIVDHTVLNPEIGTQADLDELAQELKQHGMGLIADIVPNHMGVAGDDNAWWNDVLENGPGSPFASFFDIDWMPLKPDLADKVLLPVLGKQFGEVLEDGDLVLEFTDGALLLVMYGNRRLPIAPRSWLHLLKHRIEELAQQLGADNPALQEYQSILSSIAHLPGPREREPEKVAERRRERDVIRRRLAELSTASPEISRFIADNLRIFNGTRGDPASFDNLEHLLDEQAYRLAHWQVAADEINYRRFFDVNELAAICMEQIEVFQAAHSLIFRLIADGHISGIRIDHPDGLYDPPEYLRRLQETRQAQLHSAPQSGTASSGSTQETQPHFAGDKRSDGSGDIPLYVVVEKILEPGERLPEDWPVHGTTGYEFLNSLGGLFVDRSQSKAFDRLYSRFLGRALDFKELLYDCKQLIMQVAMSSEISVLAHQLDRISEQNRRSRDFTLNSLTATIREIIACFPVYRTYVTERGVSDRDRRYVEMAVARARRRNPATSASIFEFVRDILLLNFPVRLPPAARSALRQFVGKFQQVTGPVMAKAVEDTAWYRYNRLVSLNEVGGDPEKFGVLPAAFHQQNLDRQAHWPYALLATSTHDTKRSEDVRARISVLSEIPREWQTRLARWSRTNKRHKRDVEGELAPDRNDEYLLYQTLIGIWPLEPPQAGARPMLVERIQQYMIKAIHEAKVKSSWISPNDQYEQATRDFIAAILDDSPRNVFLADFLTLTRRIGDLGLWNSLSQVVLKMASPGVPDFYQGTELFDFSVVDPDNRRPVDFARRFEMARDLSQRIEETDQAQLFALATELVQTRNDSRIKLYVILQLLAHRRRNPRLFTTGDYLPLDAAGPQKDHVIAFARWQGTDGLVVVAPRLVAGLTYGLTSPLGVEIWSDTQLNLPAMRGQSQYRNLFTGETLIGQSAEPPGGAGEHQLCLASVFKNFPVAVLERVS